MATMQMTVREIVFTQSLETPARCERALDAIRNLCEARTANRLLAVVRARQEELLGL